MPTQKNKKSLKEEIIYLDTLESQEQAKYRTKKK